MVLSIDRNGTYPRPNGIYPKLTGIYLDNSRILFSTKSFSPDLDTHKIIPIWETEYKVADVKSQLWSVVQMGETKMGTLHTVHRIYWDVLSKSIHKVRIKWMDHLPYYTCITTGLQNHNLEKFGHHNNKNGSTNKNSFGETIQQWWIGASIAWHGRKMYAYYKSATQLNTTVYILAILLLNLFLC